jgi:hypothetical protein
LPALVKYNYIGGYFSTAVSTALVWDISAYLTICEFCDLSYARYSSLYD